MPFTSHTFEIAKSIVSGATPFIPVYYVPLTTPGQWRTAGHIRAWLRLIPNFPLLVVASWIWTHFLGLVLRMFRSRDEVRLIQRRIAGGELLFKLSLYFFARLHIRSAWRIFWALYWVFGNPDNFLEDYFEAWKQRCEAEQRLYLTSPTDAMALPSVARYQCSTVMFIDRKHPLHIPCRWDMSDREFLIHVSRFYYLRQALRGFISLFSLRNIALVELIELEPRETLGKHMEYLNLGKYEISDGNIHHFLDPYVLRGDDIFQDLVRRKIVASVSGTHIGPLATPMGQGTPAMSRQSMTMLQRTQTTESSMPEALPSFEKQDGANVLKHTPEAPSFEPRSSNVNSPRSDSPVSHSRVGPEESVSGYSRPPTTGLKRNDSRSPVPSIHADFNVHHGALNLVSDWNIESTGSIVAVPIITSLLFIIIWPLVAAVGLHDAGQYSATTAFTIAIYIILLFGGMVGLSLFMDTRSEMVKEKTS